jgi:hypothetical protein
MLFNRHVVSRNTVYSGPLSCRSRHSPQQYTRNLHHLGEKIQIGLSWHSNRLSGQALLKNSIAFRFLFIINLYLLFISYYLIF